jgi:WD40 repeat protein
MFLITLPLAILVLLTFTLGARAFCFGSFRCGVYVKGGDDGVVRIYATDSQPWRWLHNVTVYTIASLTFSQSIRSVAWHSTGRYLAVAGVAMDCVVYNTLTWQPIAQHSLDNNNATTITSTSSVHVEWSPYGNQLVYNHVLYTLETVAVNGVATTARTEMVPTTTLDTATACPECSLYTWSPPNGQYIATAFENQIYILNGISAATSDGTDAMTLGSLETTLTAPTATVDAYLIIQALAWSPNGQFLAVGGAGQGYLWLYNASDWTAAPVVVETALGYGIDSLAWHPSTPTSMDYSGESPIKEWQLAVGTGRVIEIWNVCLASDLLSVAPATTTVSAPTPAPQLRIPSLDTGTPTSTPNLAIVENIRPATSAPLSFEAAVVPVNGARSVPPPNGSGSDDATMTSFSVAALSGMALSATLVSVAVAAALLTWRLRVLARTGTTKCSRQSSLHDKDEAPDEALVTDHNGEDCLEAKGSIHRGTKVVVRIPLDTTPDDTGEHDEIVKDEHFDRIIDIPCSATASMDSDPFSTRGKV